MRWVAILTCVVAAGCNSGWDCPDMQEYLDTHGTWWGYPAIAAGCPEGTVPRCAPSGDSWQPAYPRMDLGNDDPSEDTGACGYVQCSTDSAGRFGMDYAECVPLTYPYCPAHDNPDAKCAESDSEPRCPDGSTPECTDLDDGYYMTPTCDGDPDAVICD